MSSVVEIERGAKLGFDDLTGRLRNHAVSSRRTESHWRTLISL